MLRHKLLFASLVIFLASSSLCIADDGQPVAIRHWPGGGFTIETMWDIHVGSGLTAEAKEELPRAVDYEVESLGEDSLVRVSRSPNESEIEFAKESGTGSNDVDVSKPVPSGGFNVNVDGVWVLSVNGINAADFEKLKTSFKESLASVVEKNGGMKNWRVCLIATDESIDEKLVKELAELGKPEIMIVNSKFDSIGDAELSLIHI